MKEKLAFLSPVLPYPPMSGGEHYPYHLARELSREFEVHFICFENPEKPYSEDQVSHMQTFCQLHRIPLKKPGFFRRVLDLALPHYFKGLSKDVLGQIEGLICDAKVVHFDFLKMAHLVLGLRLSEPPPFTSYFSHNFEPEIFSQLLIEPFTGVQKLKGRVQYRNLLIREKKVIEQIDQLVCISERDATLYANEYQVQPIFANNAVDTREISYQPQFGRKPIFIGSLNWGPNVIGLKWFLEGVYPRLKNFDLKIVGRTTPGMDLQYIAEHPEIELIESPPSVLPYLYDSSYSVVPLLDGSGTRGKILESMAAGKPVISTSKGAEGLAITAEKEILIADTAEEFVRQIGRIESDEKLYQKLAVNGREFVLKNHDWPAVGRVFIHIYKSALQKGR